MSMTNVWVAVINVLGDVVTKKWKHFHVESTKDLPLRHFLYLRVRAALSSDTYGTSFGCFRSVCPKRHHQSHEPWHQLGSRSQDKRIGFLHSSVSSTW